MSNDAARPASPVTRRREHPTPPDRPVVSETTAIDHRERTYSEGISHPETSMVLDMVWSAESVATALVLVV